MLGERRENAAILDSANGSAIALSLGTEPGERRENAAILDSVRGSAIIPSFLTVISES